MFSCKHFVAIGVYVVIATRDDSVRVVAHLVHDLVEEET